MTGSDFQTVYPALFQDALDAQRKVMGALSIGGDVLDGHAAFGRFFQKGDEPLFLFMRQDPGGLFFLQERRKMPGGMRRRARVVQLSVRLL